jgi:hypothetical protein
MPDNKELVSVYSIRYDDDTEDFLDTDIDLASSLMKFVTADILNELDSGEGVTFTLIRRDMPLEEFKKLDYYSSDDDE